MYIGDGETQLNSLATLNHRYRKLIEMLYVLGRLQVWLS